MPDLTVVELTAQETHPLRLAVLRGDTPEHSRSRSHEDDWPGTFHLGVRDGDALVAISTWIPRPHNDEPAMQLRGMATAPELQGRGVGALLLESGCQRAASIAPLVVGPRPGHCDSPSTSGMGSSSKATASSTSTPPSPTT